MTYTKVRKLVSLLLIVLCSSALTQRSSAVLGQSCGKAVPDPIMSVPAPHRAKLKERLSLLVEYQSARQWDKMYNLLTTVIRGGRSREEYANWRRGVEVTSLSATILDFVPSEAITVDVSSDGGTWFILGCARYRRKGTMVRLKSGVTAELHSNEWLFSEVGTATQIDGPEEPCSISVQTSKEIKQATAH